MQVGQDTKELSRTPKEGWNNVLDAFNSKSECHGAYRSNSILELGELSGIKYFDFEIFEKWHSGYRKCAKVWGQSWWDLPHPYMTLILRCICVFVYSINIHKDLATCRINI